MFYVFAIAVLLLIGVQECDYTKTCETVKVTNDTGEVVSFEQSCSHSLIRKEDSND